jgi:hypothetical protein
MSPSESEVIDRAMERLRAGETINGSCEYDHGLDSPLVGCSSLKFEQGAFVFKTWTEEPVVPIVPFNESSRTLNEAEARAILASDTPLRLGIGLPYK